jgi:ribonuclease HI
MKQNNLQVTAEHKSANSIRSSRQTPHLKTGKPEVLLFCDGACSGNPGPGGWAFVLRHIPSGKEMENSGSEWETTNNRMELQAIIEGLKKLKRRTRVHVVTDSSYISNGITQWIHGWKARNWKRKTPSGLKDVKNVDLWKQLDELVNEHDTTFERIKGHAGHPENERCDEMAVTAYKQLIIGA